MTAEKIQQVYNFVEQRIIQPERVLSKTVEKTETTPSRSKLSLGLSNAFKQCKIFMG